MYYRFFVMVRAVDKVAAHWYATIEITLMDFLIVSSVLFYAFPYWTKSNLVYSADRSTHVILLMAIIFVPNYALFIHKLRYKTIIAAFEGESKRTKIIANVLAIAFLLLLVIIAVNLQ